MTKKPTNDPGGSRRLSRNTYLMPGKILDPPEPIESRQPQVGVETLAFMEGKEPLSPLPDGARVRFAVPGGYITCWIQEGKLTVHGSRSLAVFPNVTNSVSVGLNRGGDQRGSDGGGT